MWHPLFFNKKYECKYEMLNILITEFFKFLNAVLHLRTPSYVLFTKYLRYKFLQDFTIFKLCNATQIKNYFVLISRNSVLKF